MRAGECRGFCWQRGWRCACVGGIKSGTERCGKERGSITLHEQAYITMSILVVRVREEGREGKTERDRIRVRVNDHPSHGLGLKA